MFIKRKAKMTNECLKCKGKYFKPALNTCGDVEIFVNKNDKNEILCRYSENATPYKIGVK
jgi:hypothetical protein